MKTKYLIIGASAAGLTAAQRLVQLDPEASVICITDQNELPYNKCLFIDNLVGKIEVSQLYLLKSWELNNRLKLITGTTIVYLDSVNKFVQDSLGNKIFYEKLLLAVGAKARESENIKFKNIFYFHTLSDLEKIKNFLAKNQENNKQAIVFGAGVTGLECADALNKLGVRVKIIEAREQILYGMTPKAGSDKVQDLLKKSGISVTTGTTLDLDFYIPDNFNLETDMVVFAIGTEPNTKWLSNSGLNFKNGAIVVNESFKTNLEGIYAAGDCCVVKDIVTGQLAKSTMWPDAVIQGMMAASAICGKKVDYPGVFKFLTTNIVDTNISSCGIIKSEIEKNLVNVVKDNFNYFFYQLDNNNRLIGFFAIGDVKNLGKIKKAILAKEEIEDINNLI